MTRTTIDEKDILIDIEPYRNLKMFCDIAWQKCNSNDDLIVTMNGKRGTGKSTLELQMLRYYIKKNFGLNLNRETLREHMVSEPRELMYKMKRLPDKHPIAIDEGVLSAFVGDYAKEGAKKLAKLFTVCRTKHRLVIILSPDYDDITFRVRKYAVYRIVCLRRGIAAVFRRDDSEGASKDPFQFELLKKLEGYYDDSTDIEVILRRLKKHPCFKDIITWGPLPKDIEQSYDEYREEMTFGDTSEERNETERAAMIYYNLATTWEKLKLLPKLTQTYFVNDICKDPTTNQPFWKTQTHLSEELKKIKKHAQKLSAENQPLDSKEEQRPVDSQAPQHSAEEPYHQSPHKSN